MFTLTESAIDDAPLRRAVSSAAAGAVVVFHGTVRDATAGRRVLHLEYEAYPAMALSEMRRVADEVVREHGLTGIACAHRIGRLEVGETAVVVATSAPHRGAALAAVESFVALLKRDVPSWKKEHFEAGSTWVGSPTDPQGRGGEVPR